MGVIKIKSLLKEVTNLIISMGSICEGEGVGKFCKVLKENFFKYYLIFAFSMGLLVNLNVGKDWENVSEEAKNLVKKLLVVDSKNRMTAA